MSWRAETWQQLLQLCKHSGTRGARYLRALLGTWPGVVTLALVCCVLSVGIFFFARASRDAVAQSSAQSPLAQLATRIPTRPSIRNATMTPTVTSPNAALNTATPTRQLTAAPSATITSATVTPLAVSPLLGAVAESDLITLTIPVPLPTEHTGPQIIPVEIISPSHSITATLPPTVTDDAPSLLIPTPVPTATPSIIEALEKPVITGGLASIAATATAAAPTIAQATPDPNLTDPPVTESVVDEPAGDESVEIESTVPEAGVVGASMPQPQPTIASQPTPDGNIRTAHVPILMYHYLSVPPPGADIYRQDLSVAPDLFAAHLDAMQQAGYTPISLYALLDHLTHGAPLPEKPVVLTFDDGYRDNYTNAFPLLRDRGLTATFFIVTDFINDERPEYFTWEMVREMYAAGMSIEGHGRNHVSLANKDNDYLIWQALGTYETIEAEIGVRPRFISYPAGEYDQRTIDIFRSANYWAGFTTKQGATHHSDDLFQLRRIRVRGTTSPEELLRLLALDW